MDVDSPAASRIVGQPNDAVEFCNTMWRTVRRLLPKFTGSFFDHGYPGSGEHHRLATGEAAS